MISLISLFGGILFAVFFIDKAESYRQVEITIYRFAIYFCRYPFRRQLQYLQSFFVAFLSAGFEDFEIVKASVFTEQQT